MGLVTRVKNSIDGKKYIVSTACNFLGIWETAVFEATILGLPKNLKDPLLVLNANLKQEASKIHARIANIIKNYSRSKWEKSYNILEEFSDSQEILEEQSGNQDIGGQKMSRSIDRSQLKIIWDELAKVMNNKEKSEDLTKYRHPIVCDALPVISHRIFSLFITKNPQITRFDSQIQDSLEEEFTYDIQIGYMLNLIENLIKVGNIKETKTFSINTIDFIEKVFNYANYFIHTPIEISLCEFNSQLSIKSLSEEMPILTNAILAGLKKEIFSTTLYGFAAAAIEEKCFS